MTKHSSLDTHNQFTDLSTSIKEWTGISRAELKNAATDDSGIAIGGHRLTVSRGRVSCKRCDKEEIVPDSIKETTDMAEVVCRLYLCGKFRENHCPPPNPTTVKDHTGGFGSQVYKVDTNSGAVLTDGAVVLKSTSSEYKKGDRVNSDIV